MDDLIKRADAIEAVKSLPNTPNGYSDTYDKDCIIGLLEELPSADAVQGEWIKDYKKNIYKCSVCGCEEVVPTCMGEPTIWKYCPNCGSAISARMKGGAE